MSANFAIRRRGRFEALEHRHLLAGDVVVEVVRGDLIIEGDELDNQIAITAGAEAGTFEITGLNGTTVHFEGDPAGESVVATGVRDDVRIDLGEGADMVSLLDAQVRGDVLIRTGAGDDQVLVGFDGTANDQGLFGVLPDDVSVAIRGDLRVSTDGGADHVMVDNALLRGSLEIHTGDDIDVVSLGALTSPEPGPTSVNDFSGSGSGSASGRGPSGETSNPPSENGQDDSEASLRARSIGIDLGAGNDSFAMNDVHVRSIVQVQAGEGDDMVDARLSSVFGLSVFGGEGVDDVTVDNLDARFLSVLTGSGNDRVEILDSAFGALHAFLGDGDDELITAGLESRVAVLLGGEGEDSFLELRENDFLFDFIDGFELPALVDRPPGDIPFGREFSSGVGKSLKR